MKSLLDYKVVTDDIEVQYEVFHMYDEEDQDLSDLRKQSIVDGLNCVNERILHNQERIDVLNKDIDCLTNHADCIDTGLKTIAAFENDNGGGNE